MIRRLLRVLFLVLVLSPAATLAPTIAQGVPLCGPEVTDPDPIDCVPDPGEYPGDIIHSREVVFEAPPDCGAGTVEITEEVVFERQYVGADNQWHPSKNRETRNETSSRLMTDTELAECPSAPTEEPAEPATEEPTEVPVEPTQIPATEVPVTEEPVATEVPVTSESTEIPTEAPVEPTASPVTPEATQEPTTLSISTEMSDGTEGSGESASEPASPLVPTEDSAEEAAGRQIALAAVAAADALMNLLQAA